LFFYSYYTVHRHKAAYKNLALISPLCNKLTATKADYKTRFF
jgi:hypothetical protein